MITTRHESVTIWIFSLVFFPGVMLHELSHFMTAKLLRVRTGSFSLIPQSLPDGRLQLGYVETEPSDIFRDSIVGVAPLIAGCLFIAYAAIYQMHLLELWGLFKAGQTQSFYEGLSLLPSTSDFWIWFYLTFTVSSTMMPSASDRHAWLPLGILIVVLIALAILAGAGPWMFEHLAPSLNTFFKSLALIIGLSVIMHFLLIIPLFLLHRVLTKITGLDVA
jgi:Flp pilus assembly pilin Flp